MNYYSDNHLVRPKKALGQHFLVDLNIARKIVDALAKSHQIVIEVGAGMGVLTQYLINDQLDKLQIVEIDTESVNFLMKKFPMLDGHLINGDFLKTKIDAMASSNNASDVAVIGNFPYNISSQIFFQILKYRSLVSESVGMVQKEVAERIAAAPGNKTYGILSVLLQAWYDIEYLFTVNENVFNPPPKVKSAVIRLKRNDVDKLDCDEKMFVTIVKQSFNQRRKTLRNSLRPLIPAEVIDNDIFNKRPEQLSVDEFVKLTNIICGNITL
ncbi:MAG: 16S rRNA (adenine(1518)-N(6)/adenine(1519)-N(6))-dimethyltransferase RsmA [Candidatus Limimorpha sp.]